MWRHWLDRAGRAATRSSATTSAAAGSRTASSASSPSRRGSPTSRRSSTPPASSASRCSASRRARRSRSSTPRGIPSGSAELVLYGGYARGRQLRGPRRARRRRRWSSAIRAGWTDAEPGVPPPVQHALPPARDAGADGVVRRAAAALDLGRDARCGSYEARGAIDVRRRRAARDDAGRWSLHARGDRVVPVEEGRLLAARIPGARLVLLESANHILLADEPAWGDVRGRAATRSSARSRRPPAAARRRAEPARAGGARAGRRGPDQRGDRRAAVPERPHGRAAPLERLREAARLRQGGARRRRRALRRARTGYVQAASRRRGARLGGGTDAGAGERP